MARARVAQGHIAVEEIDAGLDVEGLEASVGGVRKALVVDRLGHIDLDAAEEVNELPKSVEVKHDQVVHIDAHDFADAPPKHVGSFILVDGVDAIGLRAAIGDAQVARDRDQGRGIVCRLDSGEHHGIRAPRRLAWSLVQSQQEQGERPVAGPGRDQVKGIGDRFRGDRDRIDVWANRWGCAGDRCRVGRGLWLGSGRTRLDGRGRYRHRRRKLRAVAAPDEQPNGSNDHEDGQRGTETYDLATGGGGGAVARQAVPNRRAWAVQALCRIVSSLYDRHEPCGVHVTSDVRGNTVSGARSPRAGVMLRTVRASRCRI